MVNSLFWFVVVLFDLVHDVEAINGQALVNCYQNLEIFSEI